MLLKKTSSSWSLSKSAAMTVRTGEGMANLGEAMSWRRRVATRAHVHLLCKYVVRKAPAPLLRPLCYDLQWWPWVFYELQTAGRTRRAGWQQLQLTLGAWSWFLVLTSAFRFTDGMTESLRGKGIVSDGPGARALGCRF